jgi:hypothetical protein
VAMATMHMVFLPPGFSQDCTKAWRMYEMAKGEKRSARIAVVIVVLAVVAVAIFVDAVVVVPKRCYTPEWAYQKGSCEFVAWLSVANIFQCHEDNLLIKAFLTFSIVLGDQ